MILEHIQDKLNSELKAFLSYINSKYHLSRISPLLYTQLRAFILRKGKRIRPLIFIIGYLLFTKKPAQGFYTSALALELLHDFMLIHDDIVDNSLLRRGKPSLHILYQSYINKLQGKKCCGEDLALITGDIIYAIAIEAFLAIKIAGKKKEKALKFFLEAALYTGTGEFLELLYGMNPLEAIKKNEIYRIYDYKTSYYTFAIPLMSGAALGGARDLWIEQLKTVGLYLGKAFQIRDDILGMFSEESKSGKPMLSDLQESKKTILIWRAYKKSSPVSRAVIKTILSKDTVSLQDLGIMRHIIKETGTLEFAQRQIRSFMNRANKLLATIPAKKIYKKLLIDYLHSFFSKDILSQSYK